MPTIEEYYEVAPGAEALGVTKTQIENRLSTIPDPPEPIPDPEVTASHYAQVLNVINDHYDPGVSIADAGGMLAVSESIGLRLHQVEAIVNEILAMLTLYRRDQT